MAVNKPRSTKLHKGRTLTFDVLDTGEVG